MKHLMSYEGYSSSERLDDILDKISKYGYESLSQLEKDFLDSHKTDNEQEAHDKLSKSEMETTFEEDMGYFKFEFEDEFNINDAFKKQSGRIHHWKGYSWKTNIERKITNNKN